MADVAREIDKAFDSGVDLVAPPTDPAIHGQVGALRAELERAVFERAASLLETNGPRSDLAMARFGLAKLLAQEGERERALGLAELARDRLDASDRNQRTTREQVIAWLATQEQP